MASIETELKRAIDDFEREIASLRRDKERHEKALAALHNSGGSAGTRRGRSFSSNGGGAKRGPSAGRTRTRRGQRRKQVLAHLKDNPGSRPSEIAKVIKASPSQVSALLRKLGDEKLIAKSGKGYRLSSAAKS
jgi:DNA-binding transcriptional ArsR family regulator